MLLAACSSHDEPEDPAIARARDWQKEEAILAEAERKQQAYEDARAAELQQTVLAIESDPSAPLSEAQFYRELEYYCGACHFPAPSLPPGGEQAFWLFFNDLDDLIARARVIPGDAEGSPLIQHMRADQTPPEGWNTPPVTDTAIQLVADFINGLPAESPETASTL